MDDAKEFGKSLNELISPNCRVLDAAEPITTDANFRACQSNQGNDRFLLANSRRPCDANDAVRHSTNQGSQSDSGLFHRCAAACHVPQQ